MNESHIFKYTASTPADLDKTASEILRDLGDTTTVLFDAPMGAGKTTLISALCRALGSTDDVGSPTFSIINEYRDGENNPIYHFDFYRIDDATELLDLGVEDYFYSGSRCFVEWPEKGGSLLPDDAAVVRIRVGERGEREVIVRK